MNQEPAPAGQSAEPPDITLDKLETLVEKAARLIDLLQSENADLKTELQRQEAAAAAATAQLQEQAARLRELEAAQSGLRDDAAWSRWFRSKYAGSTFYQHIHTAFQQDHQHGLRPGIAMPVAKPQQAGHDTLNA